jgi:hypothetical protein
VKVKPKVEEKQTEKATDKSTERPTEKPVESKDALKKSQNSSTKVAKASEKTESPRKLGEEAEDELDSLDDLANQAIGNQIYGDSNGNTPRSDVQTPNNHTPRSLHDSGESLEDMDLFPDNKAGEEESLELGNLEVGVVDEVLDTLQNGEANAKLKVISKENQISGKPEQVEKSEEVSQTKGNSKTETKTPAKAPVVGTGSPCCNCKKPLPKPGAKFCTK